MLGINSSYKIWTTLQHPFCVNLHDFKLFDKSILRKRGLTMMKINNSPIKKNVYKEFQRGLWYL